jgi:hypothetical protein
MGMDVSRVATRIWFVNGNVRDQAPVGEFGLGILAYERDVLVQGQLEREGYVIGNAELRVFTFFLLFHGVPELFPIARPIRRIFGDDHGDIEDVPPAGEIVNLAIPVIIQALSGGIGGGTNDLLAIASADNGMGAQVILRHALTGIRYLQFRVWCTAAFRAPVLSFSGLLHRTIPESVLAIFGFGAV